MEEGLASLPAQASLPVRPDTGRGALYTEVLMHYDLIPDSFRRNWRIAEAS